MRFSIKNLLKTVLVITFVFSSLALTIPIQGQSQDEPENVTNSIQIDVRIDQARKKLTLNYTILEQFNRPSRGVFISLPKNQAGVWTEYNIIKVQRSQNLSQSDQIGQPGPKPEDEFFATFLELNQLRLRTGRADVFLDAGVYRYDMQIEATYEPDLNYDFTVLRDWQESLASLEVSLDGKNLCGDQIQCSKESTQINLNPDQVRANLFLGFLNLFIPYILVTTVILAIIYVSWEIFARDPHPITNTQHPSFEPPQDLLPWQASYLIKESNLSIKDNLLAYILWLNHKKYIHIKSKSDSKQNLKNTKQPQPSLTIEILKGLPQDLLPAKFNQTITEIFKSGLDQGIEASKINEAEDASTINNFVAKDMDQFYYQKPLTASLLWGLFITVIISGSLLFATAFVVLQETILLGNSYLPVIIYSLLLFAVGLLFVMSKWSKPNLKGVEKINEANSYKYYLDSSEKLKLDFSNNPTEGVQYYLKSVPYAASFGILAKFNQYFAQIIPTANEVDITDSLILNYSLISFYSPSSDSSYGDGGSFGGSSDGGGSW
jgi:hypothetical protein